MREAVTHITLHLFCVTNTGNIQKAAPRDSIKDSKGLRLFVLLVNTALLDCIMSVSPCWVWNIIFRGKNSLLDDTLEKEKGINKGCSTGWQIASFSFNRYYLKGRDLIFSLLLSTIKLVLLKADSPLLGCKTWQTVSEWLWGIPVQIHYDIKGHLISLWLTYLLVFETLAR